MITQEQFVKAVKKHKPNRYTIWCYNNFSKKRIKNFVRLLIIDVLMGSFVLGFLGVILNVILMVTIGTYVFSVLLLVVVLGLFIAAYFQRRFVRKVCRELCIHIKSFNYYSEEYWYNGILN